MERAYFEKLDLFFVGTTWETNYKTVLPRMFNKTRQLENVTISVSTSIKHIQTSITYGYFDLKPVKAAFVFIHIYF